MTISIGFKENIVSRLISVIVPIYNVEDYLERCINSLVNQTYRNLEIILVDDGSFDLCPQMCDGWAEKDNRIRVIHKENGGLSDARNVGLKIAKGEYVFFVDSDDYINLDAIEIFEAYADDEDMIVAEATVVKTDKIEHRVHTNLKENYVYTGVELATLAIKKGEWHVEAWINMYKREFLIQNDLFFTRGIYHEDNDFQPRVFLKAIKVKYLHKEFYNYVIRKDSICGSFNIKKRDDLYSTYERWIVLINAIESSRTRKIFAGALCKYYLHTCREYRDAISKFPKGINRFFLLKNALNVKERVKSILFIVCRKLYVNL